MLYTASISEKENAGVGKEQIMRYLILVVTILLIAAVPVLGASSFLGGFSGNIYTPDGIIVPEKTLELSYHDTLKLFGNTDVSALSGVYGFGTNLEAGISFLHNSDSDAVISAKYRVINETADSPAVLVGVFDLAGTANWINDNPGFFIVLSKNITSFASEVTNQPSKPLRLSIGAGSGIFNNLFAGFDWTIERNLSLMAEINGGRIADQTNIVSAGLRWAAIPDLRVDAAYVGFKQFAFGANYRIAFR